MNVFTFTGNLGKDCRTGTAGSSFVVNFSERLPLVMAKTRKRLGLSARISASQPNQSHFVIVNESAHDYPEFDDAVDALLAASGEVGK